MVVSVDAIRELRSRTAAAIIDCKQALEEAGGDLDKATDILRARGAVILAKKAARSANEGLIETYVHAGGRIGVILELNCETDFVARTPDFQELAHGLALQIAAMSPQAVEDEKPLDDLDSTDGEPRLLYQAFVKDPSKTVRDLVTDVVGRVGENIVVRRFVRYELGSS